MGDQGSGALVSGSGAIEVVKRGVLKKMIEIGGARTHRAVMEAGDAQRVRASWRRGWARRSRASSRLRHDEIAVTSTRRAMACRVERADLSRWEVEVDGDDAQPLRVNYILRGVYVSAGHHRIVWTYRPAHYRPTRAAISRCSSSSRRFATRKRSLRELARAVIHPRRSIRRHRNLAAHRRRD